jgi:hypothetical protein
MLRQNHLTVVEQLIGVTVELQCFSWFEPPEVSFQDVLSGGWLHLRWSKVSHSPSSSDWSRVE